MGSAHFESGNSQRVYVSGQSGVNYKNRLPAPQFLLALSKLKETRNHRPLATAVRYIVCSSGVEAWFLSLPEPVEKAKEKYSNYRVGQRRDRDVAPTPDQRLAQQPASHPEIHRLVNRIENVDDQKARSRVIDVNLYPKRRCHVPDDRVGNP